MPHHLPRFAAQSEYLFAQTGLLSIHLLLQNRPHTHKLPLWGRSCIGLRGERLGAAGGAWCSETGCCWFYVTHTSPRGPGSLIRPVLRWCRVCRHIPGCCVCSGPRSSGTPDSSCQAGTCSTIHQPASHQTLCPLKCIEKELLKWVCRVIFNLCRNSGTFPGFRLPVGSAWESCTQAPFPPLCSFITST